MSEGPISPIVFHNYKNTANSFWTSLSYVAVLTSTSNLFILKIAIKTTTFFRFFMHEIEKKL